MPYAFNPFTGNFDYYQTATGGLNQATVSDTFSATGGVQTVALSQTPISVLMVTINGQPQNPSDYSLSVSNVTINLPDIPAGSWITVMYTTSAASATTAVDTFTTLGGIQTVTLANAPTAVLMVTIDGQPQNPSDYSVVGSNVTINIPSVPAGLWGSIIYSHA